MAGPLANTGPPEHKNHLLDQAKDLSSTVSCISKGAPEAPKTTRYLHFVATPLHLVNIGRIQVSFINRTQGGNFKIPMWSSSQALSHMRPPSRAFQCPGKRVNSRIDTGLLSRQSACSTPKSRLCEGSCQVDLGLKIKSSKENLSEERTFSQKLGLFCQWRKGAKWLTPFTFLCGVLLPLCTSQPRPSNYCCPRSSTHTPSYAPFLSTPSTSVGGGAKPLTFATAAARVGGAVAVPRLLLQLLWPPFPPHKARHQHIPRSLSFSTHPLMHRLNKIGWEQWKEVILCPKPICLLNPNQAEAMLSAPSRATILCLRIQSKYNYLLSSLIFKRVSSSRLEKRLFSYFPTWAFCYWLLEGSIFISDCCEMCTEQTILFRESGRWHKCVTFKLGSDTMFKPFSFTIIPLSTHIGGMFATSVCTLEQTRDLPGKSHFVLTTVCEQDRNQILVQERCSKHAGFARVRCNSKRKLVLNQSRGYTCSPLECQGRKNMYIWNTQ